MARCAVVAVVVVVVVGGGSGDETRGVPMNFPTGGRSQDLYMAGVPNERIFCCRISFLLPTEYR